MKRQIKSLIPIQILDFLAALRYQRNRSPYANLPIQDVFKQIHGRNDWGNEETRSGPGSAIHQAQGAIHGLNVLINELRIESLLDIPCGEFTWMNDVDLSKTRYTGADIVEAIVDQNQQSHSNVNRKFVVSNLIDNDLEKVD